MKNEADIFQRVNAEHQALEILRVLASDISGGKSNDSVLGSYLEHCGMYADPEVLCSIIDLLERSHLVRTNRVADYLVVALSDEGERVATGKQMAEGVARPSRR
ncbi:hypothetical protein E0H36_25720 [Rhizobium leguminosarum bv. viciae]|uniref:Uncharacterized protein n=1 Tax=Rhizobium leguminosarum TaxID=384 RepID=A0A6P0AYB7_RHILE|nr:hypothetical protein [Rhizobium leguminosarum]MBY5487096.1 hypothetical protein [Rhizobium leguminosarum]NEI32560.1 hypothetical protein [Rhizobium leguminosarum]NEI39319.1 hypothetical protein [Rhizobium leguminosarum]TBZ28667.1 hypothetical protein E0H36_25720 [Rhizobium leguminosarum bv. viciae]